MNQFCITFASIESLESNMFKISHGVYTHLIGAKEIAVKEVIAALGENTLHNDLLLFEKTLLSSITLASPSMLSSFFEWRYSHYMSKKISVGYFLTEFQIYTIYIKKYLHHSHALEICDVFGFLSRMHEKHISHAKKRTLLQSDDHVLEVRNLLLQGDEKGLIRLIDSLQTPFNSFTKITDTLLAKAMHDVGTLWELSEISVAKEHLATATLHNILEHYKRYDKVEPKSAKAFITSAGQELHTVGLQLIKATLERYRYEVILFDPNAPDEDLLSAIYDYRPDLIIFSQTIPSTLLSLQRVLTQLHASKDILDAKIL
ncbi:MAG: cobalamin B12-binding domain-containing protein, partial [Epsilonproteobacteria bacterium]|nr:cobalamin B12-binding domain-containing protein [Campylobacterota bacterium]